jgi:hypothetical protein
VRGGLPLLALFAIASLDGVVFLQFARDVAPLAEVAALEDVLQQAVLLDAPRPLLHMILKVII